MRRFRILAAGVTFAAFAIPSLGIAQAAVTPPSTVVPGIIVTAPRQKSMTAYIDDIAEPSQHGELAAWTSPICPRVIGLVGEQDGFVRDRLIATAAKLDIQPGRANCLPNLIVAFSDKLDEMAAKLKQKASLLFQDVDMVGHAWLPDRSKVARFLTSTQPVRWWLQAQPFSSDDPAAGPNAPGVSIGGGNSLSGAVQLHDQMAGRRGLRDSFSFVVVVVDANQAKGLPLEAIAAYASMVTLARMKDVPEVGDASSILALFTDHQAGQPYPHDLTHRDWAFLHALYATGDVGDYNAQRAEMGRKMEQAMPGREPPSAPPAAPRRPPSPAPATNVAGME